MNQHFHWKKIQESSFSLCLVLPVWCKLFAVLVQRERETVDIGGEVTNSVSTSQNQGLLSDISACRLSRKRGETKEKEKRTGKKEEKEKRQTGSLGLKQDHWKVVSQLLAIVIHSSDYGSFQSFFASYIRFLFVLHL